MRRGPGLSVQFSVVEEEQQEEEEEHAAERQSGAEVPSPRRRRMSPERGAELQLDGEELSLS